MTAKLTFWNFAVRTSAVRSAKMAFVMASVNLLKTAEVS
jgi:hypothetical protein